MRPECDRSPSLYRVGGCAYTAMRASLVALLILAGSSVIATIAGQWIHRVDPRLLRAACASKTAAMQARTMASVMTFRRPDAREIAAAVRMATEAEARAWADVDARCE